MTLQSAFVRVAAFFLPGGIRGKRVQRGKTLFLSGLVGLLLTGEVIGAGITIQDSFEAGDPVDYTVSFGLGPVPVMNAALDGTSLEFQSENANGACCYYDQIRYPIVPPQRGLRVSFDVLTLDLIGSRNQFVLLFDTPYVQNFYLRPDGTIDAFGMGTIGSFQSGEKIRVSMDFRLDRNLWTISINDSLAGQAGLQSTRDGQPLAVESLRFSLGLAQGLGSADSTSRVYLDNVLISSVPLPASGGLLGLALTGLLTGAARQRKKQNTGTAES